MSKRIAALLDEPEHAVKKLLAKLEAKNGYPSHDVRHLAGNIQKMRAKITELGLDPDDTTAKELYHALLTKFQSDSRRFDEHFGTYQKSYDEITAKAAELVTKYIGLPERWALKPAAAKALLRQHPPKHVMKQLGYRSVDSLIKREATAEIYLAMSFMESAAWNRAHDKLVSGVDSTAFEPRRLKIVPLEASKWGTGSEVNVLFSNDYGALGLEPSAVLKNAGLLSLVVLLADGAGALTDTTASAAAQLSPAAAWWSDTDGLIASLAGGNVSLNICDAAVSHLLSADFPGRLLDSAKQAFWKQLQKRYVNQLEPEEDLLSGISQAIKLPPGPIYQPAFEYAEDL